MIIKSAGNSFDDDPPHRKSEVRRIGGQWRRRPNPPGMRPMMDNTNLHSRGHDSPRAFLHRALPPEIAKGRRPLNPARGFAPAFVRGTPPKGTGALRPSSNAMIITLSLPPRAARNRGFQRGTAPLAGFQGAAPLGGLQRQRPLAGSRVSAFGETSNGRVMRLSCGLLLYNESPCRRCAAAANRRTMIIDGQQRLRIFAMVSEHGGKKETDRNRQKGIHIHIGFISAGVPFKMKAKNYLHVLHQDKLQEGL